MKSIKVKRTGKRRKRILFLYLPVLLILTLCFFGAGRFLLFNQSPQQADVIIVLSGGGTNRIEKGIELFKNDFAPYILLSNAKEPAGTHGDMLQTTLALGIPQEDILTENEAQSTYQNAKFTLSIMENKGFSSAIIVSSDFHMRRVKFLFDHVYKNSGVELTYVGSISGYDANHWWRGKYNREVTITEYTKMIGNTFGYNGSEAKKVLEKFKSWLP
ncbi:YdcF family protein [Paenibacillus sonchi]|uniref:YdcF family protein n=1 Tax=Paenibacillus sonchi TaxID=373687 RepID=UPI000584F81D|nr:YdcF family protein [Paenibacillus sonchi]